MKFKSEQREANENIQNFQVDNRFPETETRRGGGRRKKIIEKREGKRETWFERDLRELGMHKQI